MKAIYHTHVSSLNCLGCQELEKEVEEQQVQNTKLKKLLRRAKPTHDRTCLDACMDDEPEKCNTLALIKEIEEALK